MALERYVTLQFTSEGLGSYLAESSYHLAASRPLFPVLSLPTLSWSLCDDVSGWKPMTDSDHGFSHSPDTLWNDLRQWLPNGFKKYTHLPTSSTYYQLSKRKLHFIICSSKWTKFMLNFKSIYIWLLWDTRDIVEASKQDDSVIQFWNAWEPLVWVQFKQTRIFSIGTIDILGHMILWYGGRAYAL